MRDRLPLKRDGGLRPRKPRPTEKRAASPNTAELGHDAGNRALHALALPAGDGQPLDPGVRHQAEAGFGQDFSRVRVHADADAAQSARSAGAKAYTYAERIVFGENRYAPHTLSGRRLIAHELAHVVQQRRGGVSAAPEAMEAEAQRAARRGLDTGTPLSVHGASAPTVQRDDDDDEKKAQRERAKQKTVERKGARARAGKDESQIGQERATKELRRMEKKASAPGARQQSLKNKEKALRRYETVSHDAPGSTLAKNKRKGSFDERLRTPGKTAGAAQSKFVAGGPQVPGQELRPGKEHYAQPDYSVYRRLKDGSVERLHVNLKSDKLHLQTPAKAVATARYNTEQAIRNATHLPQGESIIISYARDPGKEVQDAMLAEHFKSGSPISEVRFGTATRRRADYRPAPAAGTKAAAGGKAKAGAAGTARAGGKSKATAGGATAKASAGAKQPAAKTAAGAPRQAGKAATTAGGGKPAAAKPAKSAGAKTPAPKSGTKPKISGKAPRSAPAHAAAPGPEPQPLPSRSAPRSTSSSKPLTTARPAARAPAAHVPSSATPAPHVPAPAPHVSEPHATTTSPHATTAAPHTTAPAPHVTPPAGTHAPPLPSHAPPAHAPSSRGGAFAAHAAGAGVDFVAGVLPLIVNPLMQEHYAEKKAEWTREAAREAFAEANPRFQKVIEENQARIAAAQAEGKKVWLHVMVRTHLQDTTDPETGFSAMGTIVDHEKVVGAKIGIEGETEPEMKEPKQGWVGYTIRFMLGNEIRYRRERIELPGTDPVARQKATTRAAVGLELVSNPRSFEELVLESHMEGLAADTLRDFVGQQLEQGGQEEYWRDMRMLLDMPLEELVEEAKARNIPLERLRLYALRQREQAGDWGGAAGAHTHAYWTQILKLIGAQ